MRLLVILVLTVWFALHKRGGDGTPPPRDGDTPGGQRGRDSGSVNPSEDVGSAQTGAQDTLRRGRGPGEGGTRARDIHGELRTTEREVDVDQVWSEGEMYVQDDGQIVKILDNGDGTSSIVVRDMSNPSGAPTTVIGNMPERQVQSRIDSGRWS